MVMTVLRAHVAADRVADLERAYREGVAELPLEIVETFLVRDAHDPSLFRIMTLWASRDALAKMRSSTEKPRGILMFEAAGANPELEVLEVVASGSH
jgi:hypothetical protein